MLIWLDSVAKVIKSRTVRTDSRRLIDAYVSAYQVKLSWQSVCFRVASSPPNVSGRNEAGRGSSENVRPAATSVWMSTRW